MILPTPPSRAFTLIELLTVLAIGAILMAMLLPIAQGARRQYAIATTQARFHRYTLALQQFRAEYGSYPSLGPSPIAINATPGLLVELLTGHSPSGGDMTHPTAIAQNSRKLSFITFAADELDSTGRLIDSFGQTDWRLYLDTDGNGYLDGLDGVRGHIGWSSTGPNATLHSWR